MQRLDKILASKISREKKVKHETKKLVERLRQQLDNLNNSNRRDSVAEREKHNFMAVATCEDDQAKSPSLCDRNNEEMEGGESDYLDPTITPVFQTQVIEESRQKNDDLDMKVIGAGEGSVNDEDADRRKRKSSNDSFIRRNIQLAGDAASIVAMTDDEKKRVEDLLQSNNEESLSVAEDMEACIAMRDGEGYSLDHEQLQALLDIDMQLQNMLSAEDFQAICTSSTLLPRHASSSHKSVSSCASQQSAGGGSVRLERESALVLQEQYDTQKRALAELERRLLKLQEPTIVSSEHSQQSHVAARRRPAEVVEGSKVPLPGSAGREPRTFADR
ncbi:PREDICTED: fibrous sheath-interacting protein 1-like [Priapulus caudatus]|uniref:Fibrous sheath-interacting protein 1 n=1 Tax=Priapulus caudatus TaxID=37621 RepID=A0ABM1DVH6_PRICU|nr:PREDICTED: fibrous sheath-interacting protein 1-like [Priapulus caudatus]